MAGTPRNDRARDLITSAADAAHDTTEQAANAVSHAVRNVADRSSEAIGVAKTQADNLIERGSEKAVAGAASLTHAVNDHRTRKVVLAMAVAAVVGFIAGVLSETYRRDH
ncbi:MAG TPA: hypothetical protein VIJ18_04880 [Microbacteriaceae bacterium]